MRRHIAELEAIARGSIDRVAFWTPAGSGEWRCAAALERRGLIQREASRGGHAYSFRLREDDRA